ncbi:MAG: septum formation protein Maf [Anaerolineaceae bacterium]|nr:septum formation protein Maf [Anaerolineaceae bacterium]
MPSDDSGIRRLVLASVSPRRRQLLTLLGIPFIARGAAVDESQLDGEAPTDLVVRVSRAKAYAMRDVRRDELVVAADTVVVLDGQILGKPRDAGEAAAMLSRLRARSHLVYTGVSVWQPATWRMVNELASSVVWMRDYTDAEIEAYVATGDPLDKAGAYAIQHRGFAPVDHVEGCWLTVMGLPLCHLRRALESFGVAVPANVPGSCYAFTHQACEVPLVLPD